MEDKINQKPIDKWIPWFFVFFFVFIAILDGIFVSIALKTHTGTVTDRSYEIGLKYNETLKAAALQEQSGWKSTLEHSDDHIYFKLSDENGAPLSGATAVAKITRPIQAGYDFELALTEISAGIYKTPVRFPLPGQWHIRVFANHNETPFQDSKIIIVKL